MFEQGAESSASSIAFKNNIFVYTGTGTFRAPKGCTFERNLTFGTGQITIDAMKILADPRLSAPGSGGMGLRSVDGYKLTAGSPALNAGLPVSGNGGADYWGNPVSDTSAPNLGADNGHTAKP